MSRSQLYLLYIFIALAIQAFFAMSEMALVSFHKLRLEYYASLGNRRAIWLTRLLRRPSLLFGTTLIGVNTALQFGSQFAREFYESIGLSADWAPLSQVLLVVLLGEITPMFAGRKYAEHAALLAAPLLYAFSWIFRPFIWLLDWICSQIQKRVQGAGHGGGLQLSREELQRIFEEREGSAERRGSWNAIASRIFLLRGRTARDLMLPLTSFRQLSEKMAVGEVRKLCSSKESSFFLLYGDDPKTVRGILYPIDLVGRPAEAKVAAYATSPWFLSEQISVMQLLRQMRSSQQTIAMVLDGAGQVVGLITLDEVIDAIFGRIDDWVTLAHHTTKGAPELPTPAEARQIVVDRTFLAGIPVVQFEKECGLSLLTPEERDHYQAESLEQVMHKVLGREAEAGETVLLAGFELSMIQAALLAPKMVRVRTLHSR